MIMLYFYHVYQWPCSHNAHEVKQFCLVVNKMNKTPEWLYMYVYVCVYIYNCCLEAHYFVRQSLQCYIKKTQSHYPLWASKSGKEKLPFNKKKAWVESGSVNQSETQVSHKYHTGSYKKLHSATCWTDGWDGELSKEAKNSFCTRV